MNTKEIFCQVWIKGKPVKLTDDEWKAFNNFDLLHRLDEPAVIFKDGTRSWWTNGKRNRENGPAVVYPDGSYMWYLNDELHRVDGPAYKAFNGTIGYYFHGQLHRIDGPAMMNQELNYNGWWINGCLLDSVRVELWVRENSIDLTTQSGQTAFLLKWS